MEKHSNSASLNVVGSNILKSHSKLTQNHFYWMLSPLINTTFLQCHCSKTSQVNTNIRSSKKIKAYSQHMALMLWAPFLNRSCVIRGSRKKMYFSDSLTAVIVPQCYMKEIKYRLHSFAPKKPNVDGTGQSFLMQEKAWVCALYSGERV